MTRAVGLVVACAVLALAGLVYWVASATGVDGDLPDLDHGRPKPQGGSYTIAVPEPATLNPFTTVGAVARSAVLRFTHDTLMELDPRDGSLRPALASEVETAPDGRRLVFTLRDAAVFSDGTKLGMEDVLFTAALGRAPDLPLGAVNKALQLIESARALDDRRVEFVLRTPTFTSRATLATHYVVASRSWFLAELARRAGGAAPAVGTPRFGQLLAAITEPGPGSGPYRLARWRRGTRIDLHQSPHSWRRAALPESYNLGRLGLRFVTDPAAQLALLRQGGIDLLQTEEPETLLERDPALAAEFRALSYAHLGLGHFVVLLNHRRAPLGEAAVRRGLSLLFDRERIAREALRGHATPSRTWFRPGSAEEAGAPPVAPCDPRQARALFTGAGAADLRFELLFASGQSTQLRIVELAQAAFAQARVTLDARPMEWPALETRLRAGDYDGILLHMSLAPEVDPYEVFHSSQIDGGSNYMGYADPSVDDLLARARTEPDPARRLQLFARFNEVFARDQPLLVLVHPQSSVLLRRSYRGAEPGALGLHPERWWVE